jgi:hypothetical protein
MNETDRFSRFMERVIAPVPPRRTRVRTPHELIVAAGAICIDLVRANVAVTRRLPGQTAEEYLGVLQCQLEQRLNRRLV